MNFINNSIYLNRLSRIMLRHSYFSHPCMKRIFHCLTLLDKPSLSQNYIPAFCINRYQGVCFDNYATELLVIPQQIYIFLLSGSCMDSTHNNNGEINIHKRILMCA